MRRMPGRPVILGFLIGLCVAGCGGGKLPDVAGMKLGDIQNALVLLGDGEALYRADPNKQGGYQYCSLSSSAALRGEFRLAVELATKALYLGRKDNDPEMTSIAARDLATAFGFAGKLEASNAFARMALDEVGRVPWDRSSRQATISRARRVLGENLSRQGQYAEALGQFREARDASSAADDSLPLAMVNAHLRAGDHGEATQIFQRLAEGRGTAKLVQARAQRGLGDMLAAQGRYPPALAAYAQSLKAARAADSLYHRVWALQRLGRTSLRAGDRAAGIRYLTTAMEGVETLRARFRSDEFRSGFFASQLVLYEDLMVALADEGRIAEAFAISERSRARALQDMLADRVQVAGTNQDTRGERARLREEAGAARIDALTATGDPGADRGRLAELEGKLRTIEARPTGAPAGVDLFTSATSGGISIEEVQAALPADVLVEYHVLEGETLAWRVDRGGVKLRRLPLGRPALRSRVESLRAKILARDATAQAAARDLHAALLEPVLAGGASGSLAVVPHDILHHLPFGALWDGSRYLIERGAVNVLPSASALRVTPARPSPSSARAVAFGNPTPDSHYNLRPLPAAEAEARTIASMFPGAALFTREQASKSRFLEAAPGGRIIHVAAHATYDDLDPMASAIFLAPDQARDGRLQAQEIFGLDLRASRLASLSACQTGLGQLGRGDEVVGLSRAFLAAGVRSLVLSLWVVDDESTAVLMTAFYRHVTTTTMAEALRRAQLEVLNQRPEPFFWAPFFMMDLSRA